jgi:phage gpG-like protein
MARRRRGGTRANVTIDENSNIPELKRALEKLAAKEVHIGMQGDAELAMIAGVHEYGSAKMKIPSRSFIRVGKKRATSPIKKLVKEKVQLIAEGSASPDDLLREIGTIGLERTVKRFDSIRQPPLSAAYKAIKKGKKILLRDKDLRDSLTYKIVEKESGS